MCQAKVTGKARPEVVLLLLIGSRVLRNIQALVHFRFIDQDFCVIFYQPAKQFS